MGRTLGLRHYLIALVLIAVIPAMAATAFAVWQAAAKLRAASANLLLDNALLMADVIERELDSSVEQLLSSVVAARAGKQEASEPFIVVEGRAATAGDLPADALQEARSSGRVVISNLFVTSSNQRPQVAIIAPAPTARDPNRLIVRVVSPDQLIQALRRQPTGISGTLVAVTDGTGRIVARTVDPERFVGTQAPDWAALVATRARQGTFNARTIEGVPIFFAFTMLDVARGWTVVVGEPRAQYDARSRRPLQALILAAAFSLLLVLLASGWIARVILAPVKALADHGRGVTHDDGIPAQMQRSPITEFEELRVSLQEAEAALRQRAESERTVARELAISERRYRNLAAIGALVFWRRRPDGEVLAAAGWTELTGRPEAEASGSGWTERVHVEDQAPVDRAWRAALAGHAGGIVDVELRVQTASGKWHWVRARGTPIRSDDGTLLEWAGVLEDVDERRQAQARIAHLAHHDALTGLPNRLLFSERLRAAMSATAGIQAHAAAVLWLDLDRFKDVNDTLGHSSGDKLLKAVTQRLLANVNVGDTVARIGGDEFAVIQNNVAQPESAAALAERLIDALSDAFELDGHRLLIGASIGISIVQRRGDSVDDLMQRADLALYRAKKQGRGRYCFYTGADDTARS